MDIEPDSTPLLISLLLQIASSDLGFYGISGILLFGLLLLSAAVSGSEIALFSLSTEECKNCAESNHPAERLAVRLLGSPHLLLAAILIFNNLINVSIVTLSTFVTWRIFGTQTPEGLVIVGLTFTVTLLILFFGELIPKVYATQRNLSFIRRTVFLINLAFIILKPLSQLLVKLSTLIEKRMVRKGYQINLENLPDFIEDIEVVGEAEEKEKEILKGIVSFGSTTVSQVMTSRLAITAVDISTPFAELIDKIQEYGYSRIPVYRNTIDRIEGFLYIKDLLPFLDMNDDFKWNKLLRDRYFVPQNKKIDKLLRDFQEKHVHMAIVVDEYGGTAGLITMEDIIEEIVGEINDEFDESREVLHMQLDEDSYLFEAKIPLNDFSKVMGVEPNIFDEIKGESHSLAGMMLEIFSRMPELNEEARFGPFLFTIVSVSSKKIRVVKVNVLDNADEN